MERWKKLRLNNNYEISDQGHIRAAGTLRLVGLWLRWDSQKKRLYSTVKLKFYSKLGNKKLVEHEFKLDKLVAMTFCRVPGWRSMKVKHRDGNNINNNAKNLKYVKKK